MNQVPPAATILTFDVADFDRWKTAFDAHEGARKAAGVLGHRINRGHEKPNHVSVYLAVGNLDQAKAFVGSDALKSTMTAADVMGPPQVLWLKPIHESIVWDRELPAMMVSHPVANFPAWFEMYRTADTIRKAAGIIGHAVNQAAGDPNSVVVYHQAESHAALQAFMAHPDLKAAMTQGGVTAPPQVTFHTGGWAKRY